MPFTVRQIIESAGVVLHDVGAVRWTYVELLRWINEAGRAIALAKPTATGATIELELVPGTQQRLPAGYHQMIRVNRNLVTRQGSPGGRSGGVSITPITREEIDALVPSWHDPAVLPYHPTVLHVLDDESDPVNFFVVPGNAGSGVIEVIASAMPEPIAVPDQPLLISSYDMAVPLPDAYQSPVLDFTLSRALAKDVNLAGAAQRATMHMNLFSQALGIKVATEKVDVNAQPNRYSR